LFVITFIKAITLFAVGFFLLRKWLAQNKKYYTDFPFLMSVTFFIYAIGKIYDIVLYSIVDGTADLASQSEFDPIFLLIVKIRFLISPIIVVIPLLILMLIIWFSEKKRTQIIISITWITMSILSVFLVNTYSQILIVNSLVAFPIILLSVISFVIIHINRRLPQINSLYLALGWSLYIVSQIIRPLWIGLGAGNWGLTWVGELVELGTLLIIALGYVKPAKYDRKKEIKTKSKKNINESEIVNI